MELLATATSCRRMCRRRTELSSAGIYAFLALYISVSERGCRCQSEAHIRDVTAWRIALIRIGIRPPAATAVGGADTVALR